jgi:DNA-directed RNA polymerase subunit RPC12/RpoP
MLNKGRECDNCGKSLKDEDYDRYGSWSYTCPKCGFRYLHGSKTAEEQVEKFEYGNKDEFGGVF